MRRKKVIKKQFKVKRFIITPYYTLSFRRVKGPVVWCTAKNHVLAHDHRYLAYKQKGDQVCYLMRQNSKIGSYQRALLGVLANKNHW